jgi:eukaryotic-like serine/threonine-protein kinase
VTAVSKTFNNGRYEVISKLGSGGMAIVYRAKDTVLSRTVTVKVLREQFASDEDFTKRFRREAQAVASLSHPNIVSVYDVGKDDEQEYIVMEFVDGQNLKEFIKEHAPLQVEQAVDIASQICDALDHAHKHQIIHRDIKPHNILLTADGRAKVTDFGIARAVSAATVTHTGTIVGSVHYFSPEQARGELTNEQSDLYSLGIILYEMVTGTLPYDGESPISIALKHMNEQPKAPSSINPAVPKNMEQVILRAISKAPECRYANAKELKQDLERVAKGLSAMPYKPVHRHADAQATQVMRPISGEAAAIGKKKKRLTPAGWAAIAVLVVALVLGTYASVKAFLNVQEVKMPNVVNMTKDKALATLESSNLKITATNLKTQSDDKVPEGSVISQEPPADTVIKINRPDISIVVSSGPEKLTFPDLSKTDKDTALAKIRQKGFTAEPTIEYVKDNTIPLNTVISQDPRPNTQAPKNGPISLTVSQGPDVHKIKMPNVISKKQDEAISTLDPNFTVTTETKESTQYPLGYVIDSTPKPDQDVMQQSEVKLIISAGPGPVQKLIFADEISNQLADIFKQFKNDNTPHEVVIKIIDYRGVIEVDRFPYQQGIPYQKDINYYPTAKLQILVDGDVKFENNY